MVSPWIPKGTLVQAPSPAQSPFPTSAWDHTSIISTANKIFGLEASGPLTKRDAWSAHFEDILSAPSPRVDCPTTLPPVAPISEEQVLYEMNLALNEHHLDSLNLLCQLTGGVLHPVCAGYKRSREAYMAEQAAAFAPSPTIAQESINHEHLHIPAAALLRQQHFEGISNQLFSAYKKLVGAAAS